jgi:alpha-D-xyloside xylohydrolase
MLGECLMVCPVTEPMYYDKVSGTIEDSAKTREVYLPKGTGWYDFWTNHYYEGGQTITVSTPIDTIPLYIKAGSILPMTQFMNYVDEIPDAPIEVRVYTGKDVEFELYEDEGNSYRYEEGAYAITKLCWSQETQQLQIHDPVGTYHGIIKDREYKLNIIK